MATVRKRRTTKTPSRKVTRKTANKHKKKVNIISNKIIRENWDKKATLRQKYDPIQCLLDSNCSSVLDLSRFLRPDQWYSPFSVLTLVFRMLRLSYHL